MKKLAFFLFLLFFPSIVWANNLTLESLTILNGEISPGFESLNNEYTVALPKEEYDIELEFGVKSGITVDVINNHDLENNSVVTLVLKEEKNKVEYHLHILKDEEETVSTFKEEIEVMPNPFIYTYKIYIIPATCFFLLFLVFKVLFPHHKK